MATRGADEAAGTTLFDLRDVRKDYVMGEVTVSALRGVTLSIEHGEFVVVVGPSGSGKSTLLNIMGGMDTPTSGQVLFEGRDLAGATERELTHYRRRHIGEQHPVQVSDRLGHQPRIEQVPLQKVIASVKSRRIVDPLDGLVVDVDRRHVDCRIRPVRLDVRDQSTGAISSSGCVVYDENRLDGMRTGKTQSPTIADMHNGSGRELWSTTRRVQRDVVVGSHK